ncbi:DUF4123 domain-containing protein [Buttiauxella sp.]|uniref:DUF4123 domain-containing protein n=1 Tax=Buttiauxella sp. TaxID=1972222 RepID=UPI003C7652CA
MTLSELLIVSHMTQETTTSSYALFEAGLVENKILREICASASDRMRSIFIHPQLETLVSIGPWLIKINDLNDTIPLTLEEQGALHGIIISSVALPQLAEQLSWGCVVKSPVNKGLLLRFYTPHVLQHLSQRNDLNGYSALFSGIKEWFVPNIKQRWWSLALIPSLNAEYDKTQKNIELDHALWEILNGDTDVSALLRVWVQQPQSKKFPVCIQRAMVHKALNKAQQAGLARPIDKKIYALHYLSGGSKAIESSDMVLAVEKVAAGNITLTEALLQDMEL